VQLRYAQAGAGERPLVLLHGLAARWQVFAPLQARLAEDWRIFAPDLRGHGESSRTPGGYRLDAFADDVTAFVRAVTDEPVVLYGHSLGGWVAAMVAAGHPELVRALVVADSAIYPDSIDPDLAVSYLADLPLALRSLSRSLQQVDPELMASFRAGELLQGYDPDDVLPRVRCPTLLLQADTARGGIMTDRDVQRTLAHLPAAHHARLDGLGHGLHVEDAGAVVDAVASFLGRHRAPDATTEAGMETGTRGEAAPVPPTTNTTAGDGERTHAPVPQEPAIPAPGRIRAVILDHGGVVTLPSAEVLATFPARFGMTLEEFRASVGRAGKRRQLDPMAEVETGRMRHVDFVRAVETELPAGAHLDGFLEAYYDHLRPNQPILRLAERLHRAGYRTALATNASPEWRALWRRQVPDLESTFDVAVDSGEVGVRKPEPAVYEVLVERLGVPARQCLFVDDKEENCVAAREFGMQAILFEDTEPAITAIVAILRADC
jgi:epoxide hydrolase-like predicted phosphatase